MMAAGIESVLGSRRTPVLALGLLALWSALSFFIAGLLGQSLGAWVPDAGVVLLIGLVARTRPSGLWSAALAIAAGRIAVGIEPPFAVLTAYLAAGGVHAALCRLVHGNQVFVRLVASGLYSAGLVLWLIAVHESRSQVDLGLLERAPLYAIQTAVTTALAAAVLSPLLAHLPGLGEWRERA